MVIRTFSASIDGIDGRLIQLEAVLQRELPKIHITGLPGEVVRESIHRVSACLTGLGFEVPTARILIHLSPASARKQGSHFDLPIAVAVLAAEQHLPSEPSRTIGMLGELSLDGRIHRTDTAIAMLEAFHNASEIETILAPTENEEEAALVGSSKIRLVSHLAEVIDFLRGVKQLPPLSMDVPVLNWNCEDNSIERVLGQPLAKRSLQIALAGRHHLLMAGPPGVGKSLLAQSAPGLLPPLSRQHRVEVLKNYAQSGIQNLLAAPFRSPHHSISAAAFLGGGSGIVIPGEVTLAHRGILFLDELPEFRKNALEGLREPLETGVIHLHRVGHMLTLPARFTLIAAMNPCPCGYSLGGPSKCQCSDEKRKKYSRRVSGPIFDRLDLFSVLSWEVPEGKEENASTLREQIRTATRLQRARYQDYDGIFQNGDCPSELFDACFEMESPVRKYLENLMSEGKTSLRTVHRQARVARTIADLKGSSPLTIEHVHEASGFRCPDFSRKIFGY